MKKCTRCRVELPLSAFGVNGALKSGLMSACRECLRNGRSQVKAAAYFQANKQARVAANKRWRAANPEAEVRYRVKRADKQREAHERWRQANAEKVKADKAAWKRENRDRVNLSSSAYRARNLDRHAAAQAQRRAAKNQATPHWANGFFIAEAYHLAKIRTEMTGREWHVDHIVPLNSELVCGLHVENNLAVIPAAQNLSKSNRQWPDMP